ncbi:hypothetical protein EDL79_03955 [Ehrlichia ruminantium]|uniref:Uncharacterized protein n=1 Tax=Ehrlichia ruminantium TaxID=779 RepID=A0AAE6QAJ1_EHRRU|nr:hypothetical protein [Ehrlichia ruminantium]QGR02770.1 hypothetical protein EDL81_03945 [Ehrlichia ruminantium]QGR03690.1 hypothetical protein EDL80_03945 [Ehrlichia ruminantium]QGR04617.1 hypothetical protein EDL79_03955 [Ehrlichia ruminantium]
MQTHYILLIVFLLVIALLGIIFWAIKTLRENEQFYYKSNIIDNKINDISYKWFVKFLVNSQFTIDKLCLRLPIQNRYEVNDQFKESTDQMRVCIDVFVDRQTPLKSDTIYDDYDSTMKSMKSLLDKAIDNYPESCKVEMCNHFADMCSFIKSDIEDLLEKDVVLGKANVSSCHAKCNQVNI